MKCLLCLSKENVELSREEALALAKARKSELVCNLLIIDSYSAEAEELSKRLAYTSAVYKLLFLVPEKKLVKKLEEYSWQGIYRKDFSLRIRNLAGKKIGYSEADLAGHIWRGLNKPRVNLTDPATPIELFFTKKGVFCCLLLKNIKNDFSRRKPHLRPGFAPTSLNPKLARCLVNLTGVKKDAIVDPFCGTGGILIEAGLIGLKPTGYDIDAELLKKCRENMDFYKIRGYALINSNALKINKKISYAATDLPYGRSTRVEGRLDDLYLSFLGMLKKNLKKCAVVVFPDFINYKKLINKSKLRIKREFSVYIHKSLTKKIVVLAP